MARGPRVVQFPGGPAWRTLLRTGRGGSPINDLANFLIALRNDPEWAHVLAFDEMKQEIKILAQPPVAPGTEPGQDPPRFVNPEDFTRAQEWAQRIAFPKIGKEIVQDGFSLFARERMIHPLRAWLESLEDVRMKSDWALAQPILENWLSYALGVPDDAYHREIGRCFIISMVARIMQPGCQCDYMLVLEGPQGELKSQFCRKLAGKEYFSDHLPSLNSDPVRVSMHLNGPWLIEVSELAAFNRVADVETLKAFITRCVEIFTGKYERKERRIPRQCVFIGTTNDDEWIRDASGGRRFWPAKVAHVDLEWLEKHREQLFCEAVEAYNMGQNWYPDANFERRVIAPQQEKRQAFDHWTDKVLEIASNLSAVTIAAIWAGLQSSNASGDITRLGMLEQKRIATILKKARYTKSKGGDGRVSWHKAE